MRRALRISFKILLCLGFFFLILFTFMAQLGGKSDTLKRAVEGFIADLTGQRAVIGQLNGVQFFPVVSVDFQDLSMYAAPGDANPTVTVRHFQMASDFIDVAFRNGHFRALNIAGLTARPGVILRPDLAIATTGVLAQNADTKFVITGKIGQKDFTLAVPVQIYGREPQQEYRLVLGDNVIFTLDGKSPGPQPIESVIDQLQHLPAKP